GQLLAIAGSMGGEQEVAARPEDARELLRPGEAEPLGQVREHRQGVDEVEGAAPVRERGRELVGLEAREAEVRAAPRDRGGVPVAPVDVDAIEPGPAPRDAAAAAAEVEDRVELLDRAAGALERAADRARRRAAALEEPADVWRARDPHDQAWRRDREAVVGRRRPAAGGAQRRGAPGGAKAGSLHPPA